MPQIPVVVSQQICPEAPAAVATSLTSITQERDYLSRDSFTVPAGGEGESATPENKIEELSQNLEDDWERDPVNPRNWSLGRKWVCIFFNFDPIRTCTEYSLYPGCDNHCRRYPNLSCSISQWLCAGVNVYICFTSR